MNNFLSQDLSRSRFIKVCTRIALSLAGVLGLAGLVRFFSHKPASGPPRTYDLGLVGDFPPSKKLLRPDIPAVIYQTNGNYLAYWLICTHLGCILESSGERFICPCHGSEFDMEGKVLKGPANKNLRSLEIELADNGNLLVHVREGGP